MPRALVLIAGAVLLGLAALGLFTGRVVAGSRGLRTNYYSRNESPAAFYGFIVVYSALGAFLLYNSL